MAQRRKTLDQQGRYASSTRDILREVRGKEIHEQGRQENYDEHVRRLLPAHGREGHVASEGGLCGVRHVRVRASLRVHYFETVGRFLQVIVRRVLRWLML